MYCKIISVHAVVDKAGRKITRSLTCELYCWPQCICRQHISCLLANFVTFYSTRNIALSSSTFCKMLPFQNLLLSWFFVYLLCAMLKINTLEGGVQTVDITPMTTIGELKCMLVDQRRCMGHKLVRAQILTDGMIADDDKTLEFLGVLNGPFQSYRGLLKSGSWSSDCKGDLREWRCPSEYTGRCCHNQRSSIYVLQSSGYCEWVWVGNGDKKGCIPELQVLGTCWHVEIIFEFYWCVCFCKLQIFGEYRSARDAEIYQRLCLWRLQIFAQHHYSSVSDKHCFSCL